MFIPVQHRRVEFGHVPAEAAVPEQRHRGSAFRQRIVFLHGGPRTQRRGEREADGAGTTGHQHRLIRAFEMKAEGLGVVADAHSVMSSSDTGRRSIATLTVPSRAFNIAAVTPISPHTGTSTAWNFPRVMAS